MFTCPNCQARSIGLKAKIQSSLFRPIECSKCGALFVISRLAMILALFIGEVVAFFAMQYLEPGSIGVMVELTFTVVVIGLIYSFVFAPLERISRAEPAPVIRLTTYVLLFALIVALALVPIYAFVRA